MFLTGLFESIDSTSDFLEVILEVAKGISDGLGAALVLAGVGLGLGGPWAGVRFSRRLFVRHHFHELGWHFSVGEEGVDVTHSNRRCLVFSLPTLECGGKTLGQAIDLRLV